MHEFINKTIREIALAAPITTRVFEEFKIDFCCGGRVPFDEACRNASVDPLVVLARLEDAMGETPQKGSHEEKAPKELIDHIVETHHTFTRSEVARLRPLAAKVATRHGENHPELILIRETFDELADDLLPHMQKEEMVLFPYIERLAAAADIGQAAPVPPFGTVRNPIRMMMFEHDRAGDLLKSLRQLSNDFTAPGDSCPSYKGLYAGLEDLERDLHRHVHLENNILFPKAAELEAGEVVAL